MSRRPAYLAPAACRPLAGAGHPAPPRPTARPAPPAAAQEGSGGRYDLDMKFEMAGPWAASVVIAEPGRPVALVPLKLQVR